MSIAQRLREAQQKSDDSELVFIREAIFRIPKNFVECVNTKAGLSEGKIFRVIPADNQWKKLGFIDRNLDEFYTLFLALTKYFTRDVKSKMRQEDWDLIFSDVDIVLQDDIDMFLDHLLTNKFYLFYLTGGFQHKGTTCEFKCKVRPQPNNECLLCVAATFGEDQQEKEFQCVQCDKPEGFIEPAEHVVELLIKYCDATNYLLKIQ